MTARVFKPGDLAFATVRGEEGVLVSRGHAQSWISTTLVDGCRLHYDDEKHVSDLVPTVAVPEGHVVLDPEDAGQMLHVAELFARTVCHLPEATRLAQTFRALAAEQSRPPLAEPGQWAVCEASTLCLSRRKFTHWEPSDRSGHWVDNDGQRAHWAELLDPVLVRPGVDDEAES